jgi:hypothetical protein
VVQVLVLLATFSLWRSQNAIRQLRHSPTPKYIMSKVHQRKSTMLSTILLLLAFIVATASVHGQEEATAIASPEIPAATPSLRGLGGSNDRCNYSCPPNSHRKNGRTCYDSFDDCACNDSHFKWNSICKPKPCYQCPKPHWERKQNKYCYNDLHRDCKCAYGYKMYNGKCIEDHHY